MPQHHSKWAQAPEPAPKRPKPDEGLVEGVYHEMDNNALYVGSQWSPETDPRIVNREIKFPDSNDVIPEQLIHQTLENAKEKAKDPAVVRGILKKALDNALLKFAPNDPKCLKHEYVQGLTIEDAAILLNLDDESPLLQELFDTAKQIKHTIYGSRLVLFAPLYLSNWCSGSCTYCAYNSKNKDIERAMLNDEQLVDEVKSLHKMGHRRLVVLTGEHPKYPFERLVESCKTIGQVQSEPYGQIRRINVEVPPLSVSDMARLKETDAVGTLILFQETYSRQAYKKYHPRGPKADYDFRLFNMDRAFLGGLDDVGLGALFGLVDYRFDVLALLMHANYLDKTYNCGPHTISVPRLTPAAGADTSQQVPNEVNDLQFKKLISILRCAVPYTGIILSTRESPALRHECMELGVSQMSAGSHTDVGSYEDAEAKMDIEDFNKTGQFSLKDTRPTEHVVLSLLKRGYIPSWCTGCYRVGRTGEKFMAIAKRGDIADFCQPNALLTLAEYLIDYAKMEETKKLGWEMIEREKKNIKSELRRKQFDRKLGEIRNEGKRDLFF